MGEGGMSVWRGDMDRGADGVGGGVAVGVAPPWMSLWISRALSAEKPCSISSTVCPSVLFSSTFTPAPDTERGTGQIDRCQQHRQCSTAGAHYEEERVTSGARVPGGDLSVCLNKE